MKETTYQTPQTELYEIKFEGTLLNGGSAMNPKTGSWDEDNEG